MMMKIIIINSIIFIIMIAERLVMAAGSGDGGNRPWCWF